MMFRTVTLHDEQSNQAKRDDFTSWSFFKPSPTSPMPMLVLLSCCYRVNESTKRQSIRWSGMMASSLHITLHSAKSLHKCVSACVSCWKLYSCAVGLNAFSLSFRSCLISLSHHTASCFYPCKCVGLVVVEALLKPGFDKRQSDQSFHNPSSVADLCLMLLLVIITTPLLHAAVGLCGSSLSFHCFV